MYNILIDKLTMYIMSYIVTILTTIRYSIKKIFVLLINSTALIILRVSI